MKCIELKKKLAYHLHPQFLLLIPFYLVLNLLMNIFSLCFLNKGSILQIFRQHAASIYGFVRQFISLFRPKKIQAISKQGRRLRFGMLSVLTNIRSTKVLWQAEDDLRWKTTFSGKRPQGEDDLWWKTTLCERQTLVEDNPRWKRTFGGR